MPAARTWPEAAPSLPCPPAPADLGAALGELRHLRAAILELCAAEGVRLERDALLLVHAALDDAVTAIAGAIAHAAIVAGKLERDRLDLTLRLLPVGVFI